MLGVSETLLFFQRKIKGSICFFIGLVFIITNVKIIGILLQIYGLYEFFKTIVPKLLPYLAEIHYIKVILDKLNIEVNDGKKAEDSRMNV